MAIIQTFNLVGLDGKAYAVAVNDKGAIFVGTQQASINVDPQPLADALDQAMAVAKTTLETHDPTTMNVGNDTLTCDMPNNHTSKYHHDPRGFYWADPAAL